MTFEYKLVDAATTMVTTQAKLNELGADGWEVVAADPVSRQLILKRPTPQLPDV